MKRLSGLILTLFLSACAHWRFQNAPANQALSWAERTHALACLTQWDTQGRIALINRQAHHSTTANFHWQTHGLNQSVLELYGPLGIGRTVLKHTPTGSTLTQAHHPTLSAATPEQLLYTQLHENLPVRNLYYWYRGLPAPGTPWHGTFDAFHHLLELEQSGWDIQYRTYQSVKKIDLPRSIVLKNNRFEVRLAIHQWNFNTLCPKTMKKRLTDAQ